MFITSGGREPALFVFVFYDCSELNTGPAQGSFSAFAGTRPRVLRGPEVYEIKLNYPIKKHRF